MHEAMLTQKSISNQAAFCWWMQQNHITDLNMNLRNSCSHGLQLIWNQSKCGRTWRMSYYAYKPCQKDRVYKFTSKRLPPQSRNYEVGNYGYAIQSFWVPDVLMVNVLKFVFFFICNKTSYVACTKVLYNYDRLWFNLQHLYTLNKNILKSKKKPYVQSLFIILWIFFVCRKVTSPSSSNHSDLIASDFIIMTQLVNMNLLGIPERTITAPHVSCSGASRALLCALLSFLTA